MKKHYKGIFFFIGLAGIVWLALKANPDKVDWQEYFTPKLLLLLGGLLALWALIYAIHARAFRLVMGEAGAGISRISLYRLCMTGFALNNVTPAGLVGGEPYRILELKKYMTTEKATSSTISFSLMYVIGHVLLWLTGALLYFFMGCPGEKFVTILLIVSALILLAICIYFFAFRHKALVTPAFHFFSKLPLVGKKAKAIAEKRAELFTEVDRCYAEFHGDKRTVYKVILLEYGARLLEGMEYFLIFLYLGTNVHISGAILILSLASLIGNLLFMVPMQAGTREGGMAIALDILGISSETGLMGGLIYRIRDLICTTAGILLILTTRKKKEKREDSKPAQ
ncbi:MAG: flippase-like domain-containing protein [Firmicutes bacterium]|nr:flippase-like domain-containing protein [Lachnospiraceae bacterium]MBQ7059753.1 flippase-like domain-containing protein [Bacillota bacterium]